MTDLSLSEFQAVTDHRAVLGEGLCFVPKQDRLYWLDIKGNRISALSVTDGSIKTWSAPDLLSSIAPTTNGTLVGTTPQGFGRLTLDEDTTNFEPIANPEPDLEQNRFNDGKVDHLGRYWAGTMDNSEEQRTGNWWYLDRAGKVSKIDTNFMVTNGPAFSADGTLAYLNDSADGTIFRVLLSPSGEYEKSVFMRFSPDKGYPDGITIDRENHLWVAFWDGRCVRRISPDGSSVVTYPLPARRPTSIEIIGGQLFVTSASTGLTDEELGPHDGKLLRATLSRDLGNTDRFLFDDSFLSM